MSDRGKLPGLTHDEQKQVEASLDDVTLRLERVLCPSDPSIVRAAVAEWAMRFAMRAGLLDAPRLVVRTTKRRR